MIKNFTLVVPFLKRVLHTNKFTSLGALLALVAVVLLKLHDITSADFLVLIGSAVTVIGFASKDGVRADSPVAPENVTPGPDVPPFGPGAAVVGLLLLLGVGFLGACKPAPPRPAALDAVTLGLLATHPTPGAPVSVNDPQRLAAALDSAHLPPYLVAPPKGLSKRQERQFRRAQRKALIVAAQVVPGKLKVQQGSAYNAAPDGTAVALHKSDAPVGIGAGTTTDNRDVGRNAHGGVSSAARDAGPATGASEPPKPGLLAGIWAKVQQAGWVIIVVVVLGAWAWVRFGPVGSTIRRSAALAAAARAAATKLPAA